MKLFLVLLISVGVCFLVNTSASSQQCLKPKPDDSKSFGKALALSQAYLAVGDPQANRVVLYYQQTANGDWSRMQEILPPPNSDAAKVGSGFGYDLAIDDNILVIGAYTVQHQPTRQEGFQWTNLLGVSYSGGVYTTELPPNGEVKRIDEPAKNKVSGFSVTADQGMTAYGVRQYDESGRWADQVELRGGKVNQISSPPAIAQLGSDFGQDLEMKNNRLVVGASSYDPTAYHDDPGRAWLFNLKSPAKAPQRLTDQDVYTGGSRVAMSDQFVAVSAEGAVAYAREGNNVQPVGSLPKTLIIDLKKGSTEVIDGFGNLSLDGHLLVRTNNGSYELAPAQLERFDISNVGNSRLLEQRRGIYRAQINNNVLVTVQKKIGGTRLCIEPNIQ